MTEASSHPSRLLRNTATLVRWSLRLLLALCLLLALVWGGLHGWIVPRIAQWQGDIEHYAQRALGVPVRMAGIAARSEGIFPTIELSDIRLLDAQGATALWVPQVEITLSPQALLRRGVARVDIQGITLDIQRDDQGQIWVAGLPLPNSDENTPKDNAALDWLLAQPELSIRAGTLRWADAQASDTAPVAFTQVNVVLRNAGRQHSMRVDATLPPAWGKQVTLQGDFRAPLLPTRSVPGQPWLQWNGRLFAHLSHINAAGLQPWLAAWDAPPVRGRGTLRAWLDVQRGQVQGGTADVALADVQTTLGPASKPLALRQIQGRLEGKRHSDKEGITLSTHKLQLVTGNGLHWPDKGDVVVRYGKEQGSITADRLDVQVLTWLAQRLPLSPELHQALTTYAPQGLLEDFGASWKHLPTQPVQYQARGRVHALALGQVANGQPTAFGLTGGTVDFNLTQAGGSADVGVQGALLLPGVFEEAVVPVQSLAAKVRWNVQGGRVDVAADDVQFATHDAAGTMQLTWHMDEGQGAALPGVLDLSGQLHRADAARTYRYLPLVIPDEARHYVRDAIRSGSADGVQFRVKGPLHDMPFSDGKNGEFRIAAQVKDVTYAYVPPTLQEAGEKPWPVLTQLQGELIFAGAGMHVRQTSGNVAGQPGLRVTDVQARIADFNHSIVEVEGRIHGPLAELLETVHSSHIADLTHGALDAASADGNATLQLALSLPLETLEQSSVRGNVTLAGNSVRLLPEVPWVNAVQGSVQFTENGFTLEGVQGQALGGLVTFSGGMQVSQTAPSAAGDTGVQVQAHGRATAEGLRQAADTAPALAPLGPVARYASGSADWSMALGVQRGVVQLDIQTPLQGMAFDLPAPLGKTAERSQPVHFGLHLTEAAAASENAPLHDLLTIAIEGMGNLAWERDLSAPDAPRVRAGAITLGLAPDQQTPPEPAKWPQSGVAAHVEFGTLNLDDWLALLPNAPSTQGEAANADYLPSQWAMRAAALTLEGRTLRDVVLGLSRDGSIWRANIESDAVGGYLEYRPDGDEPSDNALLYARLSRLALPLADAGQGAQSNTLLDESDINQLPDLDIVVDDFELRGQALGRLDIQAANRANLGTQQREWHLQQFNLTTPEATLTSDGLWALRAVPDAAEAMHKQTSLNFRLDIHDAGNLLARLGMEGVLRRGAGQLEGEIDWIGSPLSPDWRSMHGAMHIQMENGQFLQADPGLAKLLSVLSLQSLPRRLALDFRDVFSEGFAFDFIRGDVQIAQGTASTNNLQMKGVNAAVLMEGSANIEHETQQLRVIVVPEINAMSASLVATAINPVVGLGSFLAQMFLRGPLMEAATHEFRIDGTWSDPHVERVARSAAAAEVPKPAAEPTTELPVQEAETLTPY